MASIKERKILPILLVGSVLLFFYLPIIVMIVFSFNQSRSLTDFTGFSLNWYQKLFHDRDIVDAITTSLSIGIISTVISTVVGTVAAIGLSKSRKIIREVVLYVNQFPVLNPEIVTAISLMLLFSFMKIDRGYITVLLAHIAFSIPYVILSVLPKIRSLDPNITEAALDLGATPIYALVKVIVPQIIPGIISGALIAFTMSIDDFVITYFVTGNGVKNISILVYTMSKRINPMINALSSIMVLVITFILLAVNIWPLFKNKREKNNEKVFD